MRLPNPNSDKPYQRIIEDKDGQPLYGIRAEHTPDEEIVYLPTGQSNQIYWQPEKVLNPEGCKHEFVLTSAGRRECECNRCGLSTSFVAGLNYSEKDGKAFISLQGHTYPLRTSSSA